MARTETAFSDALSRALKKASSGADEVKVKTGNPESVSKAKLFDTVSNQLAIALGLPGEKSLADKEVDHGASTRKFVDFVKSTESVVFNANQIKAVSFLLRSAGAEMVYHGGVSGVGSGIDTKFSQLAVSVKSVKDKWASSGSSATLTLGDLTLSCIYDKKSKVWRPVEINGIKYSGYRQESGSISTSYK